MFGLAEVLGSNELARHMPVRVWIESVSFCPPVSRADKTRLYDAECGLAFQKDFLLGEKLFLIIENHFLVLNDGVLIFEQGLQEFLIFDNRLLVLTNRALIVQNVSVGCRESSFDSPILRCP